jgi:hypothetical protein
MPRPYALRKPVRKGSRGFPAFLYRPIIGKYGAPAKGAPIPFNCVKGIRKNEGSQSLIFQRSQKKQ